MLGCRIAGLQKAILTMPDSISIGDRYHRPGGPRLVYRVVRLADFPHHPPHVALVSENADRRPITIGLGVLQDPRQWVLAE